MFKILTRWQQERFNEFEEVIHRNEMFFRNSKYRQLGKTYLLNELGLTLQALGYKVLVYTPYDRMEYFAERFIRNIYDLKGIGRDKIVILFDEANIDNDDIQEIIEYCENYQISIVGFVRYEDEELKEFKIEFECKWIN